MKAIKNPAKNGAVVQYSMKSIFVFVKKPDAVSSDKGKRCS